MKNPLIPERLPPLLSRISYLIEIRGDSEKIRCIEVSDHDYPQVLCEMWDVIGSELHTLADMVFGYPLVVNPKLTHSEVWIVFDTT
mgnify:CR=1 FL=1